MVHRWQVSDWRSHRRLLDPEVFLNGSNPPPTDLIDKSIWDHLVHLTDHVAITTSNHHGTLLRRLFELDRGWVEAIPFSDKFDDHDLLSTAMVDVMDDFHASIFLMLHGFYRHAIFSLRSILETTAVGACFQLSRDQQRFKSWRHGEEIGFGRMADTLATQPVVVAFETKLRAKWQDDLFSQRSKIARGGWSRRLYGRLCEFSHSRPGRTNTDLWASNGPIYVAANVQLVTQLYAQTFSLAILLVRLARPHYSLPTDVPLGFEGSRAQWATFARRCHALL